MAWSERSRCQRWNSSAETASTPSASGITRSRRSKRCRKCHREGAVVRAEAAPHREVVGAIEDVDGIQLEPADVFDEATEAPGGQRGRAGAAEVLPLEEERGDGAQRGGATWHPMEVIIVEIPSGQ